MAEGGNFQNANPVVYEITRTDHKKETYVYGDENEREEMTAEEIFGLIASELFSLMSADYRTYPINQ
jgi:hypothetical protein